MKTAILILLCLTSVAFGRIGETEDEITAHYGASVGDTNLNVGATHLYRYHDYFVEVTFSAGISCAEVFKRTDASKLSAADMASILLANSPDQKWDKIDSSSPPRFISGDKKVLATMAADSSVIIVSDVAFMLKEALAGAK